MSRAGDIDYAQARLSARMGERPSEMEWRSIEAIRGLDAVLDAARGLRFRRWLTGIAPGAPLHAIEAALVSQWRAQVAEVCSWMPARWQSALAWTSVLADLPLVEYRVRGGVALPWMREDPVYGRLCESNAPPSKGPFAPLASAWDRPDGLFSAWRDEWNRRVPRGPFDPGGGIDECARALAAYRTAVAGFALADGAALRRALASRLARLFRRVCLEPAAALVFLALTALDLERLRGELAQRAIFPHFGIAA